MFTIDQDSPEHYRKDSMRQGIVEACRRYNLLGDICIKLCNIPNLKERDTILGCAKGAYLEAARLMTMVCHSESQDERNGLGCYQKEEPYN